MPLHALTSLQYWIDWLKLEYGSSAFISHVLFPGTLLLVVLVLAILMSFQDRKKKVPSKVNIPLQALLTVLTPTCSIWPKFYRALVNHAHASEAKTIKLPLAKLFEDISRGNIEFRDLRNDLPDLLCGNLRAYAWSICLEVEVSFQVAILRWLSLSDLSSIKVSNPPYSVIGYS